MKHPPSSGMEKWLSSAMSLPWPLSGLFNALFRGVIRRDPTISVSIIGTVGITSVGMFAKGHSGWGFAPIMYGLGLIVGGTTRRPVEAEGRIELREILNLTVMFDHDVIDGAPAARFARRLVELIESGYGLEDPTLTAICIEPAAAADYRA